MGDSTLQINKYSFFDNYTNNSLPTLYEDLVLEEIQLPIKERVSLLSTFETRDCDKSEKIELPLIKSSKSNLNYICHSLNWIGNVNEIKDKTFTALLINTYENTTHEIAEFEKKDISNCDLHLLNVGAVFYWSIGYANYYGQIIKQSFIRFKRSINLSNNEFESIMNDVDKLKEGIMWE